MFAPQHYELIDFGDGEKLERFAGKIVRRVCPTAYDWAKADPANWASDLRYQLDPKSSARGAWRDNPNTSDWTLPFASLKLQLKPTPYGHLGIFPEQAVNWKWFLNSPNDFRGAKVLNLFAYTGATSLVLASLGANVVHVDSAKSVVAWARENAALSGLKEAPIRWIVEDAVKFVSREIKRGNRYDLMIADPPSFGHGPKKQSWKYERDIEPLVESLAELKSENFKGLLLSGHTEPFESQKNYLRQLVGRCFGDSAGSRLQTGPMNLRTISGRELPSGYFVRC